MTSSAEITSLPTGEPVPSSTPPAQPPKAAAIPISAALAAAPANMDAFLAHLHRCLQTPTGIDCVLQFVCYASRLTAASLTIWGTDALRSSAKEIALLVLAMPPQSAALLATTKSSSSPKTAASALALLVAARLRALGGVLAEARIAHRLWGLLGMYFWARRLVAASIRARRQSSSAAGEKEQQQQPAAGAAVMALQWAQLLSCVGFQLLENVAYLSSKGVLGWSPAEQAKLGRWSSRFWGTFVGLEMGRLAFEATKGAEVRTVEWKKTMTRYVAWSPVIMHWGSEGGLLSELGVAILASVPSVIQMKDLWQSTAASS